MATSSQQGPLIAPYLTMLWDISWTLCPAVLERLIPRSTEDYIDIPINMLSLDQALASDKSLWTILVLLASWSREIFPLVASSHI